MCLAARFFPPQKWTFLLVDVRQRFEESLLLVIGSRGPAGTVGCFSHVGLQLLFPAGMTISVPTAWGHWFQCSLTEGNCLASGLSVLWCFVVPGLASELSTIFLCLGSLCAVAIWLWVNTNGIPFWLVGEFTTRFRLPILVVGLNRMFTGG